MSLIGMGSYGHLPRIQETSLVIYRILVIYCILVSYCIPVERLRSESHFRLVNCSFYQKSSLSLESELKKQVSNGSDFFSTFCLIIGLPKKDTK